MKIRGTGVRSGRIRERERGAKESEQLERERAVEKEG